MNDDKEKTVTAESSITLREVTKDTVRAICNLKVSDSQTGFVEPNAVSIAQAYFQSLSPSRATSLALSRILKRFVWMSPACPGSVEAKSKTMVEHARRSRDARRACRRLSSATMVMNMATIFGRKNGGSLFF